MNETGSHEARAALTTIAAGRRRMLEQLDVPRWYWWSLGLGWIVLGVLADFGNPVVTSVATFVFGAVHSAVAPRVIDGRHRSDRVSLRADAVYSRLPLLIIGTLVAIAAVTVGGSLAISADGAAHPTTITSIVVASLLVFGGPQLVGAVRRRAMRSLVAG